MLENQGFVKKKVRLNEKWNAGIGATYGITKTDVINREVEMRTVEAEKRLRMAEKKGM